MRAGAKGVKMAKAKKVVVILTYESALWFYVKKIQK